MIELSPEQKENLQTAYNINPNLSINDLALIAFPTLSNADGRTKEVRLVRDFFATLNAAPASQTQINRQASIVELTEEQKTFVRANSATMTIVEMAQLLFQNPQINGTHREVRVINEFIQAEGLTSIEGASEVPLGDYIPPKSPEGAYKKVEKFVPGNGFRRNNLTGHQKGCLEALMNYLGNLRLVHQIQVYERASDRLLFESTFIRYTYDKPDLTQEEVDQYIVLAHETVESHQIQIRKAALQRLMEQATNAHTEGDISSRVRLTQPLVEAIQDANEEYNQCVGRQQKLLGDLKQKRSTRIKELKERHSSVLNLFRAWKEEKSRKAMLEHAQKRNENIVDEMNKIEQYDEIRARILGISKEEVLYG